MKNSAHIYASKGRPKDKWPDDVETSCGAEVKAACAVLDFEMPYPGEKTTMLCRKCLNSIFMEGLSRKTWYYAVLPEKLADRFNAKKGEEE